MNGRIYCKKIILLIIIVVTACITGCKKQDYQSGWTTYRHDGARSAITPEILSSPMTLKWTYIPTHTPDPVWDYPAEEMKRSHTDNTYHVSAANGMAYFGSSVDNKIYALDIYTGKERWSFFTEGPVRFSPTIWNKHIYFGSDDGYA